MSKKFLAAAIASLLILLTASCSDGKNQTPSDAEATVETATTQAVTTAPTTTTEPQTTQTTTGPETTVTTTRLTTSSPTTTTKRATTTVTTIATKVSTTVASAVGDRIRYDETEDKTLNETLKYGVIYRASVTEYYKVNDDGTRELVDTKIKAKYYDRTLYSASYEDLLPAAKENRKKYSKEIDEVLSIINGYRAEGGLEPLVLNEELTVAACARAEEIAWSGVLSHTRPNLSRWTTLFLEAGFNSGKAGENIGRGYATPKEICQGWKDSQTHYDNLMNPEFKQTGIGVSPDPDPKYKNCWAQWFLS